MFVFQNSLFIDSPLSSEGINQAKKLQRFINDYDGTPQTPKEIDEIMKVLQGDSGLDSVLITSPLRRAIATGCVGLYPRMKRSGEKIIMHTSLQEMSRNVDTMALAEQKQLPECAVVGRALGDSFKAKACLDVTQYKGNKKFRGTAIKRMEEFNDWCFQRPESIIIVSAGHSLWFKNYFKTYLPKVSKHPAAIQKMHNCSIVAFNLEKGVIQYESQFQGYRVVESSITPLYLGFEKVNMEMNAAPKLKLPQETLDRRKDSGTLDVHFNNGKKKVESSGFMCCAAR